MLKKLSVILFVLSLGMMSVFAQSNTQTRTVAVGQKMKLKGVIISKDTDKLVVRDATGVDTNVSLTSATSIKTKGGFFGGGDNVASSQLVRGLNLEIEGTGDGAGNLVAKQVRFTKDDFKTAQSIDSRVSPAEERLSQAEQNAQRVSGQIDELMAVSNAARGGAKGEDCPHGLPQLPAHPGDCAGQEDDHRRRARENLPLPRPLRPRLAGRSGISVGVAVAERRQRYGCARRHQCPHH